MHLVQDIDTCQAPTVGLEGAAQAGAEGAPPAGTSANPLACELCEAGHSGGLRHAPSCKRSAAGAARSAARFITRTLQNRTGQGGRFSSQQVARWQCLHCFGSCLEPAAVFADPICKQALSLCSECSGRGYFELSDFDAVEVVHV